MGRDLDALFATRVLGLDLSVECEGWQDEDSTHWRCDSCGHRGMWGEDFKHTVQPRHYTQSLDAAWAGVEKVSSRTTLECLHRHRGDYRCHAAVRIPCESDYLTYDSAEASHPALALVKACLLAVGVSQEEIDKCSS